MAASEQSIMPVPLSMLIRFDSCVIDELLSPFLLFFLCLIHSTAGPLIVPFPRIIPPAKSSSRHADTKTSCICLALTQETQTHFAMVRRAKTPSLPTIAEDGTYDDSSDLPLPAPQHPP